MRRPLALFVSCCLTALPAFSWWESGHQVVARIAAAHLTPAARTRIARILEVSDTPQEVADALAKASTWADETKGQTHTGNWHFVDLTVQDSKADIPKRCKDDDCAPARIQLFAHELRARQEDRRWSELDELRYLVHLVGDIHQPLHAITDADQGGNCEQLSPPVGQANNLHALWDGGIVDSMDTSMLKLTASLQDEILTMTGEQRDVIARGGVDDWTWESHELALRDIYHKLHIPVEPPEFPKSCAEAPAAIREFKPATDALYVDSMKPVVRLQLIRAGMRLARLLNESM